MKQLTCEMCGGTDLIKQDGVFVCQSCGTKYSVEEAKKMMIEGTVEVKGTVVVDNSNLIENYFELANNAINAGNNSEAEIYCNKIIEIEPNNYKAWMLKGKAAAWQSTLQNSRVEEGVNAFSKAILNAPENEKDEIIDEAKQNIKDLCLGMICLQTDRFSQWPDEEETQRLMSIITDILSTVVSFLSQSSVLISLDEIMKPIATKINQAVIKSYQDVIYPEYKSQKYPYPDYNDWQKFIARIDYCITLVDKSISLCSNDEENDIQRYENLIFLENQAIKSCSYQSEYFDFGSSSYQINYNISNCESKGLIVDVKNSKVWSVEYVLNDEAKSKRKEKIDESQTKIKDLNYSIEEQKLREEEEKRRAEEQKEAEQEAYWAEHPDEKLQKDYAEALSMMEQAKTEDEFKELISSFKKISPYKDSEELEEQCIIKAETARKDEIYSNAIEFMNHNTIYYLHCAIKRFQSITGWKDSDEKITSCKSLIEQLKVEEEQKKMQAEADRIESENKKIEINKKRKKLTIITISAVSLIIAFAIVLTTIIIPNNKYKEALKLFNDGKYNEASVAFNKLDNYKDSNEQIEKCEKAMEKETDYDNAMQLYKNGKYDEAITIFKSLDNFKDSKSQIIFCENAKKADNAKKETAYNNAVKLYNEGKYDESIIKYIQSGRFLKNHDIEKYWMHKTAITISGGWNYTIGLRSNGTVIGVGENKDNYSKVVGQTNVSGWKDIVSISAGYGLSIGLRSDGTVIATGSNYFGECNVSGWKNIVAISAGNYNTTAGLQSDGTVIVTSKEGSKILDWDDIISISAGGNTVGLKSDGTVVATGSNYNNSCDVSNWKDIVAISSGWSHTVGLKSDGTVVAVGDNNYGQCNIYEWKDIVAISSGQEHTVGLKSDGTVIATGDNFFGQCNVSGWENIVAISACYSHTVGLKSDGTIVAVGYNGDGQCNVSDWKNIKQPERKLNY